jgi:hypothetical protein
MTGRVRSFVSFKVRTAHRLRIERAALRSRFVLMTEAEFDSSPDLGVAARFKRQTQSSRDALMRCTHSDRRAEVTGECQKRTVKGKVGRH